MAGARYLTITLSTGEQLKITEKRNNFSRHIANGIEPSEAYLDCFTHNGKKSTVKQSAQKILKYPEVQKAIDHYRAERKVQLDISDEAILAEYANKAWGNLVRILATCTTREDLTKLPTNEQRLLKKVTFSWIKIEDLDSKPNSDGVHPTIPKEFISSIEIHDPNKAQDRLAEINGLIGKNQGKGQSDLERDVNVNINLNGKTIKVV